jgi:hypothetical protein
MGDVPAIQQVWHSRRHKEALLNHQMDMALFQVQPSIQLDGPGNGETRRRQGDIVDEDHSKVNDESTRRSRGMSAVDKRQGTGNIPDPQLPTCSRMRETSYDSLQMAMPSVQGQPSIQARNLGYRERRRCQGDAVYDRRSTKNDEHKGRLTKSSVRRQERSTDLYSQTRRPKASDKSGRHIDNGEGTGNIPDPQQPTHSRTCKQHHNDQWTAVLSSEPESSNGSHLPVPEKSR